MFRCSRQVRSPQVLQSRLFFQARVLRRHALRLTLLFHVQVLLLRPRALERVNPMQQEVPVKSRARCLALLHRRRVKLLQLPLVGIVLVQLDFVPGLLRFAPLGARVRLLGSQFEPLHCRGRLLALPSYVGEPDMPFQCQPLGQFLHAVRQRRPFLPVLTRLTPAPATQPAWLAQILDSEVPLPLPQVLQVPCLISLPRVQGLSFELFRLQVGQGQGNAHGVGSRRTTSPG